MTRACLFLAAFLLCALAFSADLSVAIANPSFEDATPDGRPAVWSADPAVYQLDDQVAHTGKRSLRYTNADPARYVLCSQPIALQAGRLYELSVWVKTKGLTGDDTGATICLEWSDKDGKWIGGAYPAGLKGDTDWTLVKGIGGRVPAEATSCSVTVYCRKGLVGTAWFDDVSVQRAFSDPLAMVMTSPNYRGWLPATGPGAVSFKAWLDLTDLERKMSDLALVASLVDGDQKVLATHTFPVTSTEPTVSLALPATLPRGPYEARLALVDKTTGAVLSTKSDRVVKPASEPNPRSYIDAYNRLIVDGKPFLPLGCYWSASDFKDDLVKVYADSAFNCLMPYGEMSAEQMDLAQRSGLKVLFSIKDSYFGSTWCPPAIKSIADERTYIEGFVKQFRDHPALLGWYLNDELGLDLLDRLTAHQRFVEELDPNHPTWVVLYQFNQVRQYATTFDAIGCDPYPIPNPPVMAATWTRTTREEVAASRPVWMVPQIMSWKCYDPKGNGRTPTFDEMRSMAWQCLCEGATGLVFYSFFDIRRDPDTPFDVQWDRVKRVAAEIKQWSPVLLSIDKPVAVTGDGLHLHCLAKASMGKTYFFVSSDGERDHILSMQVPIGAHVKRLSDGASLTPDAKGRLYDYIPFLGMVVYEIS